MPKTVEELPKTGQRIPANKFFVSKMNVRVDEAFGNAEEDKALTQHLTWRNIVQPFIARPEGDGYGVVIGRRRFLAKMESKAKEFEVGKDCYIREMSDEEALDASLRENLALFRRGLNPIARAKAASKIINMKVSSLRSLARLWRIPASTLSDWLRVLELSEKMQKATAKGLVSYTDALNIARLELGVERQDELANLVENEGYDAFKSELNRLRGGKGKRGIPLGKYSIIRLTWDKRYPPDMEDLEKLEKLAKKAGKDVDEYSKDVLRQHAKSTKL